MQKLTNNLKRINGFNSGQTILKQLRCEEISQQSHKQLDKIIKIFATASFRHSLFIYNNLRIKLGVLFPKNPLIHNKQLKCYQTFGKQQKRRCLPVHVTCGDN